MNRMFLRNSPELQYQQRKPPAGDLHADPGDVLGEGGFGKIRSLGKDSVEKDFIAPASNAEADRYEKIRDLLGCNRGDLKQRSPCCNHFLFAVRRGRTLLLSPRGIPLSQFFDSRVRDIAEGSYPEKWKRCGTPQLCTYLFLMRDLISAVKCLHRVHMAHGDIKPGNVIVDCPVGEIRPRYTALLVDLDALQEIDKAGHATQRVGGTVRTRERHDFEAGRMPSYNAAEDDWYATAMVALSIWKAWLATDGSAKNSEQKDYADLGIGLLEQAVAGSGENCARAMEIFQANVTRNLMRHMCDAGSFDHVEPLDPRRVQKPQEPSESLPDLVHAYRDWYGFDDKCAKHEDCKGLTLKGPDGRVGSLEAPFCCKKKKTLEGRCVDMVNMKGVLGDRCQDAGLPRTNMGLPERVSRKVRDLLPPDERVSLMRELLRRP